MSSGWVYRAYLAWEILVEYAKNEDVIKYGDLAKQIGIGQSATAFPLEIIQEYCQNNNLPPLTILGSF